MGSSRPPVGPTGCSAWICPIAGRGPSRWCSNAVCTGRIGRVFHSELAFHNAYGPGKAWFYDHRLAGGGCVIDLGVHLVDLALWTLGFPQIIETRSRLYNKGVLLKRDSAVVEDFATAHLLTEDNTGIALQCSWNLHAGCDAAIAARFYGDAAPSRSRM